MNYVMKSGCLSNESSGAIVARIKSAFPGPVKRITRSNTEYHTDIRHLETPAGHSSDVRFREYILVNQFGTGIMIGKPEYADGDDPAVTGWPICRMPRVDHARITIGTEEYGLVMHNSQNYSIKDQTGCVILRIMHRGLTGGWQLYDDHGFTPEILCAIFAFCRYIEQENELLIV